MTSRAKKIRFLGEAQGQGASRTLLKDLGDVALDFREVPRALVMQCPDGCGQILSVNLDKRSGKAWRLYGHGDKLTLYPSVWREEGCEAHFIVWKGQILWCDGHTDIVWNDPELVGRVNQLLAAVSPQTRNYVDIAQHLDAIPWEVLWACQSLVTARKAARRNQSEFFVPLP
ncbi:MAG: hypothetical protein EOP84_07090 [Verrucomicrobiaceae bacterium]|nr:MAG: hypothetical protein EOP84_07090 [Verrucomicrobiaceae bacterium]